MDDRPYLKMTIDLAKGAANRGQTPVGCVITDDIGEVIASRWNESRLLLDRTAHAEMLTIRDAMGRSRDINAPSNWTIYVSLEPCPMCISAIVLSRFKRLVWAAPDPQIRGSDVFGALPYPAKERIERIACPFADLQRDSLQIYRSGGSKYGK
jgi:tRNA(adenine34) deaminase